MLLLLFRNCCRILWKPLNSQLNNNNKQGHYQQKLLQPSPQSQQQFMIWLLLLFLLSQQHGSDCRPTAKGNHRAQRRFMWRQMDSTVDGFVGRVVSGARVMKGMIGEFMPPHNGKQGPGNALDYLPTETTRVKYIIRNPHTKETKVIKIRPSKKVVKIMAMTPKPLMNDQKHKTIYMLEPGKMRQLEREQELIAEGKLPAKHDERPASAGKHMNSSKGHTREHLQNDNGIVSGSGVGGNNFGDTWRPVYKEPEAFTAYSTVRPSMMSSLHTSIVGELLPQPQKQVYEPMYESSSDYREHEQDPNKSHTYEVTEYTAEESVMQPLTHDYYSYRHVPVPSLSLRGVSHRHTPVVEPQQEVSQKEVIEELPEKVYLTEYRPQRGAAPSRTSYRYITEASTASPTTTTTSSTTTTEEPNYPASFLKRMRERPESLYPPKHQPRNKPKELILENSWLPSNVSYASSPRNKPAVYHHTLTSHRIKSQKWPPDVEETQNSDSTHENPVTTDSPSLTLPEYETHTSSPSLSAVRNTGTNSRKNVRLKMHHGTTALAAASSSATSTANAEYHRHRNGRHRGTIRFGDKLEVDEG